MKQEHINEIKAIIILALGMIILASLISFVPEDLPWHTSEPNVPAQNLIRVTGAYLAGSLLFVFGYSSYFFVVFLFFWAWNKFSSREIEFTISKFISFLILFCVISSLFSMTGAQESIFRFERAGIIGTLTSDFLIRYIGRLGAYVILLTLGTMAFIITGEFLVTPVVLSLYEKLVEWYGTIKEKIKDKEFNLSSLKPNININQYSSKKAAKKKAKDEEEEEDDDEYEYVEVDEDEEEDDEEYEEDEDEEEDDDEEYEDDEEEEDDDEEEDEPRRKKKPKIKIAPTKKIKVEEKEEFVAEYQIPPLTLLDDPPEIATSKIENALVGEAKLLESTLINFGVNGTVKDIERGPAITRYEIEPAPGVKVQKFTSLADDIALAMKAAAVRIVAPIPGKNRVGIEVPNSIAATVYLKEILASSEYKSYKSKLTLSLGKDIAGKPMIADLAEMPHLLIAGTTGSGKSVCMNGIIMSILLNASPEEVRFVMVDPKMVELAQYNGVPHLLCPTVTDTKKAGAVLNWVVGEMETRYKQLSKAQARNIKGYNAKGNKMPYIVVIIDELADLMQVSAKSVESAITRIAQLSRAVGIHLILATQRPSVDVITGVIKANFPARIAFNVLSKVDSRTILDTNGADALLGKGDMLFMQPGEARPTRGQCNFVNDKEINSVIGFIKDQQEPSYDDTIIQQQKAGFAGGDQQKDEYYDEAVRLVIETNQASVSILQRRMRLGYTRAARLIDMMEQNGIVGPYAGSKPRDLLVDREQWLLDNMQDKDDE